ncbi:PEP-CTERM sorting domain-containing protein [Thalassotalea litorea]|uniref:PEP-CTERM sorting domain-containing protein n=1 Tax=Thalassotalea litorea TaxID=2020715 RepID=A0A5R9IHU1_9GAMM|nr:PEP-CTERM sorting domain-containing protein [Thalassotalea litorea]TLU65085.1 PEP-CTERM sorting domain-containing protein [Thalassotalea litorea]
MITLKTLLKVSGITLLLSLSSAANAELIKLLDFTETKPKDEGAVPGVFTFTDLGGVEGFNVTFTTNTGDDHWLDAGSGLGICPLDDCNRNSEDNINEGEGISFSFTLDGTPIVVADFTMLFAGHDGEGIIDSMISADDVTTNMISEAMPLTTYTVASDTYAFVVTSGELYLGSIWIDSESFPPKEVPEPANVLLLLTGLAGLLASRKRK